MNSGTDAGAIVAETWQWLERQHAHVALDEWRLMPDHLHGIILRMNVHLTDRKGWTSQREVTAWKRRLHDQNLSAG